MTTHTQELVGHGHNSGDRPGEWTMDKSEVDHVTSDNVLVFVGSTWKNTEDILMSASRELELSRNPLLQQFYSVLISEILDKAVLSGGIEVVEMASGKVKPWSKHYRKKLS